MIEDSDTQASSANAQSPSDEAFTRSYDFFKHLTGICLVSIGGVLSLLQQQASEHRATAVIAVIVSLILAGLLSMIMVSSIAVLGYKGPEVAAKLRKAIPVIQGLIVLLLLFGLGVFVGTFMKGLLL
jgi:hypothetical protein